MSIFDHANLITINVTFSFPELVSAWENQLNSLNNY